MCSLRFRTFLGVLCASTFLTTSAFAQGSQSPQPAPQQPPQQPSTPQQPQPGGRPGTQPGRPGTQQPTDPGRSPFPGQDRQDQRFPDMQQQRVFMFSGKVILDDGTPPPDSAVIEFVCNGQPKPQAYTDSKGRFSFQLGQNQHVMADASVGSSDPFGRNDGMSMPGMGMPGRGNITERDIVGCELRAALPGFRSDVIPLAGRRALDNPDVGTIVLHRLAKVDGFTFSATTAYAPKKARKAFEKGEKAAKKKKWADAEKHLTAATAEYPKYAAAWFELGLVYEQQKKLDEAKSAYQSSIEADNKYLKPYAQLAGMSAAAQNWEETADYSSKLIRLNPYFSPHIYFLSGVANLNLNRLDPAEEHAREALKMDDKHRNPKISYLLGLILAQKADYAGAVENMRAYLQFAPNATDAETVKTQLAEVERRLAQGTQPVQAQ